MSEKNDVKFSWEIFLYLIQTEVDFLYLSTTEIHTVVLLSTRKIYDQRQEETKLMTLTAAKKHHVKFRQ